MILFLDFDGVLHPISRPQGPLSLTAHFEHVMRDFPQVEIVISSAWRQEHSLTVLRSFFSDDISARMIDITPDLAVNGVDLDYEHVREKEIRAWLRNTGRETENWIALDDTDWFFSPTCRNLIRVNPEIGFDPCIEAELRHRLSTQALDVA